MKKGWQTKTLGDVCAFDKAQGIHRGLPYVGLEHIESHTARFIGSGEAQPVKSSTFRFSDEHVLYGRLRPYLNKALAPDFEGHCSTEIFPLKPRPELSREYLLFWLLADETCDRINATCTGARMPRAQMNDVLGFEIPVPPLAEQQRIVGLLDEAFEGLATAKANAEKNLQNARALFESHLQSVFTQRGEGSQTKTLEEACQFSNGLWKGEKPPFVKVGVIRNTNFTKEGTLDDSDIAYLDVEAKKLEKRRLQFGDIILEKSGGGPKQPVGRVALFDKQEGDFSFSNFTAALRVLDPDELDFRFVHRFLHWTYLSGVTKGMQSNSTGIRNLDGDAYKAIDISFPPLAEQQRIVAQLDALSQETQRLARLYERKHAALEALKKSLLHQAFTREL